MSTVKTFRERQKEKGNAEIRGVFINKELHTEMKSHIKHIQRLLEKGITNEHISNRLARIDLED